MVVWRVVDTITTLLRLSDGGVAVEWVFPILWVAIFAFFYLTEGRTTVREWRLRLFGQTVNGRVTSVRRSVGRYGPVWRGSVVYSSPRGKHTITGHVAPDVEVGQDFLVRYLPGNPEVAVMSEGVIMLIFKTIVVTAVTAILIAIALGFAR